MTDIFDQEPTGAKPTDTTITITEQDDLLAALVGEGKKYKTVQELAKSRLEADKFIEQLKTENAAMRNDLTTTEGKLQEQLTLEQVLAKIDAAKAGTDNQTGNEGADIQELIRKELESFDSAKTIKLNREKAQALVLQRFNNDEAKAKDFVQKKAAALGISTQMLGDIAAKSPLAYEQMLGLSPHKQNTPSLGGLGDVNSATGGMQTTKRNAAHYKELRQKLGASYYEPRIQTQMMKDRESMSKEEWYSN